MSNMKGKVNINLLLIIIAIIIFFINGVLLVRYFTSRGSTNPEKVTGVALLEPQNSVTGTFLRQVEDTIIVEVSAYTADTSDSTGAPETISQEVAIAVGENTRVVEAVMETTERDDNEILLSSLKPGDLLTIQVAEDLRYAADTVLNAVVIEKMQELFSFEGTVESNTQNTITANGFLTARNGAASMNGNQQIRIQPRTDLEVLQLVASGNNDISPERVVVSINNIRPGSVISATLEKRGDEYAARELTILPERVISTSANLESSTSSAEISPVSPSEQQEDN